MTITLKINSRNDLHLPATILRRLNLNDERVVKVDLRGHSLVVTPVDFEPRYSVDELDALDRLHAKEKSKGFKRVKSKNDIDRLLD